MILSIDYRKLCDDSIDSVEKLEEALHDFKINCQELWDYLRDSRISPCGSVKFILELLKRSISLFCQQIYLLCEYMIVLSINDIDNNAHNANKNTKEDLILDILPENEYLDEFLENIEDESEVENDAFLSNDLNSNTETYESIDQGDTSKAIENNSLSETFFYNQLFNMLPYKAPEIINQIILLFHNGMRSKVNRLYDEIKRFIESKQILVHRNKIQTIINSKRLAQMIEICKNNQTKTNYLIKSTILYNSLQNASLMYRNALIGGDEDCSYTESKKDTVFNYNMYEDLQCALSRLYGRLNGINL